MVGIRRSNDISVELRSGGLASINSFSVKCTRIRDREEVLRVVYPRRSTSGSLKRLARGVKFLPKKHKNSRARPCECVDRIKGAGKGGGGGKRILEAE